ncbi:MAG TPA: heme-binding protein, partial [Acetobacteraceae bacterium]
LDAIHATGLALAAGVERWTALEGGCPIIIAGECIGGVGISGGSFEFDERVAREAVEAIGATW